MDATGPGARAPSGDPPSFTDPLCHLTFRHVAALGAVAVGLWVLVLALGAVSG